MTQDCEDDTPIELGRATTETKGLPVNPRFDSIGDQIAAGMSHD